jgi:hypothetical protein
MASDKLENLARILGRSSRNGRSRVWKPPYREVRPSPIRIDYKVMVDVDLKRVSQRGMRSSLKNRLNAYL